MTNKTVEEQLAWWQAEADRRGKICIDFAEENDRLTSENEQLRAALQPFAACQTFFEHHVNRKSRDTISLRWLSNVALLSDHIANPLDRLTVGHFRQVFRALRGE